MLNSAGPREDPPPDWIESIEALIVDPGVAMVLGASDTGKTTWVAAAARRLAQRGLLPFAIVDADIGQSTIGPPTAVALSCIKEKPEREFSLHVLPVQALSFVGSLTPVGHLLQTVVATKRMVDKAFHARARAVLVDTTGLIDQGAGFQLKLRKIDLLAPAHLIVLQRGTELEDLLSVLRERPGLQIHRLRVSPSAKARSPAQRSRYRADLFYAYFRNAAALKLDPRRLSILSPAKGRYLSIPEGAPPSVVKPDWLRKEDLAGLLVGLNNSANETLALGLLQTVSEDRREIHVRTPLSEGSAVRVLQLGSLRLTPSDHVL